MSFKDRLRQRAARPGTFSLTTTGDPVQVGPDAMTLRLYMMAGLPRDQAMAWAGSGVRAEEARMWAQAGFTPESSASWRRAGEGPSVATEWGRHGLGPDDFVAWGRVGVHELADVLGWRSKGLRAEEASQWVRHVPHGALSWAEHFPDPEEAARWARHTATPLEAIRWRDSGMDPRFASCCSLDEAMLWARAHVGFEGHQAWHLEGIHVLDALRWIADGCSRAEAAAWLDAGYETPAAVASWRRLGLGPAEARDWSSIGILDGDEAAEVTRRGLDPDSIRGWGRLGVSRLADVIAWHGRWPLRIAMDWYTGADLEAEYDWYLLVDGDQDLRARLLACGLVSADLARTSAEALHVPLADLPPLLASLADAGVTVDEAATWRPGHSPEEMLEWIAVGVSTAAKAKQWTSLGQSPSAVPAWRIDDLDPLVAAGRWLPAGFAVQDAMAWIRSGVADATEATLAMGAGLGPGAVGAWRGLGASSLPDALEWSERWSIDDARGWVARFPSLELAYEWHRLALGDMDVATRLADRHQLTPARVDALMASGYDAAGVANLLDGFDTATVSPESAMALCATLPVSVAVAWTRAGFLSPSDVEDWRGRGFDVEGASQWKATVKSAGVAAEWRSAGATAREAGLWCSSGIARPGEAAELVAIGLTAEGYGRLMAQHGKQGIAAALRRQAVEYAGLTLTSDEVTVDITDLGDELIHEAMSLTIRACAAAGEARLLVHHGAPHLSPEMVAALPDARFVRGREKVAVAALLSSTSYDGAEPSELGGVVHAGQPCGTVTAITLRPTGAARFLTIQELP